MIGKTSYTISEDAKALLLAGSLIVLTLLFVTWLPEYLFPQPVYKWSDWSSLANIVSPLNQLAGLGVLMVVSVVLYALFQTATGVVLARQAGGFAFLFFIAQLAQLLSGNSLLSSLGLEYVFFCLIAGLLLNFFFKLPVWLKQAAQSEFFIKTGLVLLGSSVLFQDILRAGLPGILQALLVVLVVWFFAFWLSRKWKLDDEFAVILSSAVSICGVSAAIVAAGAINGDKRKLSYVSALVLIVAIPMLILLPVAIKYFQLPAAVAGAWLGGTLDTTASVTAAAEQVGKEALQTGVVVKFSQNVLIGLAAFFITAWWLLRKGNSAGAEAKAASVQLIWQRFPKFVLGFLGASLLFSFVLSTATVKQASGWINSFRTAWFALAFVSIGIEIDLKGLVQMQGSKPAVVFIIAQLFNILWTLLVSWILFGILFK